MSFPILIFDGNITVNETYHLYLRAVRLFFVLLPHEHNKEDGQNSVFRGAQTIKY